MVQLHRPNNIVWIWRSGDRASWYILIIKPTRWTNFSNLFWNKTLHISESFCIHHQEFFAVHTAMVYGLLTACEQDQDGVPSWSCSQYDAWALHVGYVRLQTHTQNMYYLLLFHYKEICTNEPQFYLVRTLLSFC